MGDRDVRRPTRAPRGRRRRVRRALRVAGWNTVLLAPGLALLAGGGWRSSRRGRWKLRQGEKASAIVSPVDGMPGAVSRFRGPDAAGRFGVAGAERRRWWFVASAGGAVVHA